MLGGQLAALSTLVLLSHTLMLNLTAAFLVVTHVLPVAAWLTFVGYGLLLLLPSTLLEIGVCAGLGLMLRHSLVVVVLTLALTISLWLGLLMPSASLLNPLNHTWLTLQLNALTGLGADRSLVQSLGLAYAAGGLALLVLGLLVVPRLDYRLRQRPRSRLYLGSSALLLALLVISGGWRYTQAVAQQQVPESLPPTEGWRVEQASHHATVAHDRLTVQAELVLRNTSAEDQATLVLGLNPGLTVQHARTATAELPTSQHGETIQLQLAQPVAANAALTVTLDYAGRLRLLREDYAAVAQIAGDYPAAYRRPVLNIQEPELIFLSRDGDWRAWPLTASAHTASHNEIVLQADLPMATVATTAQVGGVYRWSDPLPQVLLVSGNFAPTPFAEATLYLPPAASRYDDAYAQRLARTAHALAAVVPAAFDAAPQIVLLPYLDAPLISADVVVAPLHDPAAQDQRRYLTSDYWALRGTAQQVAYAWLSAHVSAPATLTTTGQLISYSRRCDAPSADGSQHCTLVYSTANPQVPAGRLVAAPTHAAPLQALSVVLGQQMVLALTNDTAALAEEQAQWHDLGGQAAGGRPRTADQLVNLHLLPRSSGSALEDASAEVVELASTLMCADQSALAATLGRAAQASADVSIDQLWIDLAALPRQQGASYADCY